MFANFDLGVFLLAVLPVLLAITVREVARGYTARYWGDHTGEQLGRLTLNPLPHIDPVGTIVVPLVCLMIGSFLFGWARPMPIDSRNFRDPRRAWRWVSISGPIANLILAFFWGFVVVLAAYVPESYQAPLAQMARPRRDGELDLGRIQPDSDFALGRRYFYRYLSQRQTVHAVP